MRQFYCTGIKNLNITVNGVIHRFENNQLETDDESLIAELLNSPFVSEGKPEEVVAPVVEETTEPPQLLFYKLPSRISVEDAKRYADERGIAYPDDVIKTELIDAINLAQQDKL